LSHQSLRPASDAAPLVVAARTAWHSHPLGQTLIVAAGCGRVQRWGNPIEEIHWGDVIQFAASQLTE
jgi:quercetin dioxygenase-like cupin family protein